MPNAAWTIGLIALALPACTTLTDTTIPAVQQDSLTIAACEEGRPPRTDEVSYSQALLARMDGVPVGDISEFSEVIDGIAFPPPQPVYPIEAAIKGREGACLVYFDQTAEGRAESIEAACTRPEFASAAEAAVAEARFPPAMVGGAPSARPGMVYPITFCQMR